MDTTPANRILFSPRNTNQHDELLDRLADSALDGLIIWPAYLCGINFDEGGRLIGAIPVWSAHGRVVKLVNSLVKMKVPTSLVLTDDAADGHVVTRYVRRNDGSGLFISETADPVRASTLSNSDIPVMERDERNFIDTALMPEGRARLMVVSQTDLDRIEVPTAFKLSDRCSCPTCRRRAEPVHRVVLEGGGTSDNSLHFFIKSQINEPRS